MPGPNTLTTSAAPSVVEELDETEVLHLKFIREEEKMARDVYRYVMSFETQANQQQKPKQQKGK